MIRVVAVLSFLLLPTSAALPGEGEAEEERAPPAEGARPRGVFHLELTALAWLGSVDGSLQTPAGGQAGTTSPHRPTTEEIGLEGLSAMPVLDAGLRLFEKHEVRFQYARVNLSGEDVLESELVSQGQVFPAGSTVESHLGLDLFRVGYRARWLPFRPLGISLSPEAGFSLNPFSYRLSSPSATGKVDRSYSIGFPYLGLLLERRVFEFLALEVDLAGSGGINGVSFVDSEARLVYRLPLRFPEVGLVAGLKGTWLRRRDSQKEIPNDINLRLGAFSDEPWGGVTAGLRLGF